MIDRHLVFASPHSGGVTIPSRPAALWAALSRAGTFRSSVRVERLRPDRYLTSRPAGAVIAHPWPFGPLERRFLRRIVDQRTPAVLWISDPKSAAVFRDLAARGRDRCLLVFDAYDAWDLSPLVRGRRRRRAVANGYRAAAEHAHVIFGNTPFVVDRFQRAGAANVVLLPNAAPEASAGMAVPAPARPYLLYVGRIHERLDASVLTAVAVAYPDLEIHLAGPVEREPSGWRDLVRAPNVRLLGPVTPDAARQLMAAAAACLVPHIVDDYSLSQDAMKAWDALAVGAPLISTGVPPADAWSPELALVANDAPTFVAAVGRVLGGGLGASRQQRLAFAAANTWAARAGQAISVIQGALEP